LKVWRSPMDDKRQQAAFGPHTHLAQGSGAQT
jgi:hypothetical protein